MSQSAGATSGGKRLFEDLPDPDPGKLNPHFILGVIIDHIEEALDEFPHVDIPQLRRQLSAIRNHDVDPEKHVRGFLNVFKRTTPFKAAFEQLDDDMKKQVEKFMAGAPADKIVGSDAFHVPPSPAAKHHFKLLDLFKIFKSKGDVDQHLALAGQTAGLPIIYEDAAGKKIMEVSINSPLTFAVPRGTQTVPM
jgi:hypothetical protein